MIFSVYPIHSDNVALIISGLAGDKQYYNKFWGESNKLYNNLIDYKFAEKNIIFLFEDNGYNKNIVYAVSDLKNIKLVFQNLSKKLNSDDRLFLFLIGHASEDIKNCKFHLRGPDLSPEQLQEFTDLLPVKNLYCFINVPYSGKFISYLGKKNRIIITSCDKNEKNQPYFLEEFNKTLSELKKNSGKDDDINFLQILKNTKVGVSSRYAAEKFIITEHSQIDSNGDGIGHNDVEKEDLEILKETVFNQRQKTNDTKIVLKTEIDKEIVKPDSVPQKTVSDTIMTYIKNAPQDSASKYEAVFIYKYIKKDVNEEGVSVITIHNLIKIFTEGGRDYTEIEIPSSYGEAPEIIVARTFKPDGTIVPVDFHSLLKADFENSSPGERDMVFAKFSMPAIENGCVIEYAYRFKSFSGYSSVSLTFIENLQMNIPVLKSEYVLAVPSTSKVEIIPKNLNLKLKKTKANYSLIFNIETDNISAAPVEIYSPPRLETLKGFVVSTPEKWEDLNNWFYHLARPQLDADTNIKNKVIELTAGCADTRTKIKKIYEYVSSKIRYVAIELGIHGYKPHYAPLTFANKYGDCKDKATLFITMLKCINVEAFHCLINAFGGDVDLRYSFLGAFNHCISAVKDDNGNFEFFDVTPPACPFNYLPHSDQDRYALVVCDEKGKFIRTPLEPPSKNILDVSIELTNVKNHSGVFNFLLKAEGAIALDLRSRLFESSNIDQKNFVEMLIKRYEKNCSLLEFKIQDIDKISAPLIISGVYESQSIIQDVSNITIYNINLPK